MAEKAAKSLPCQREVPSLRGGWIPTGFTLYALSSADGQESLRLPAASTSL